ncbi:DNA polymerase III subunit delta [Bacillus solimangrovi]|uniref:DNA polymerase III subunit delta n=1 Tax=Bacillus solimangrovi TaxID=1305675 RepID=A0A1E5LI24_9BACI|nr:DNA polymerase III subunit delta [Bacillus solimangrovi]OEH93733.1 DNA polymerase III subunit delta [Bacillus solimangrovi]
MEVQKEIKQGIFYPVYLFYGSEHYLIEDTKQKLIHAALTDEDIDFNLSYFDMTEVPVQVALEDAQTLPFMGERRVVIMQTTQFLTAQKEDSKIDHDLKRLEQYIDDPSPETILVIIAPYEKLDERKKIVKAIKKRGGYVKVSPLSEQEIQVWVRQQLKERHREISDLALTVLLQTVGVDLTTLASELEKLSLYAGEEQVIDEKMVQLLVARSLEQNIFDLTDMVLNRNLQRAFRIFYDMIEQKEEPLKILALLAGQFRLLYQVKGLMSKGYGQNQIASTLKVHPFRVKLAMQKVATFDMNELLSLMDDIAEVDYKIKSGQVDKQLAVELFMMKLHKG